MLIVLFLTIILISIVFWTLYNGISPMPTSSKTKKALLNALPKIESGQIIDLGSGWGTLLFPLAKHFPHCTIVGFETSPLPYLVSRLLSSQKNIQIHRKDFFSTSLKDAKMVVCYLYPAAMQKVREKFDQELREGTWVISHTFAVPSWQPKEVITVHDIYRTKIYIYQK